MASSSNNPEVKHDVFLSFRGEDTRNIFTSHLEAAFRRVSIKTFIDDKLGRGEEISPSLLEAIEQSKISVIVLSEKYASSRWCLEELAKILDRKKRFGQMVIPIFYHVDPSHVRNQTGNFGAGFAALEKRFEERLDALQRWKTALKEVANLSGWTTDSKKDESVLIEEIIMDILKRLNKMSPSDHSDLIGVEPAIKEIESLLEIGSNDVRIVGIWGIGGIGKTSISRAIFNKHLRNFKGSCFVENVREESNKSGELTSLCQELLSKLLEDKYANKGFTLSKERLACKKVLIVFDDVTSLNQIENLIGDPKCLGLGSRIIITSRDKQVLYNICGPDKIYKLEGLFYHEAFQLFSRYAFRHNGDTIEEYMEQSKRIVTYAKGVPLALKVLGSYLSGKTKQEWESALNKLERRPLKDIQNVLKISFDSLDDEEKELFLDIACIFNGENKDLIIGVIDSCGYSTRIGLGVLIDKSLVIESYDNKITMHDLLEEMGREIVRQESIEDPGKRSRLFHHKDIYRVLTRNKGTEAIKSICLDVSQVGEIHLAPHAFSKMPNLKYLKIYNSHYGEGFNKLYGFQDVEFVFLELKYLFLHRYPWTSLPPKFHPENLVALEMPKSNIEQLWPGVQDIVNLKHIDLNESKHLLKCPDLSSAKNLETLNFKYCTSLIEIHSSIQYLNKLSILNLRGCKSLCSIPSAICSESLRTVVFSGCSNLDTMPSISCNVEMLYLGGSAIRELSSSIGKLSKLVTLDLHGCTRLESLPSSIGELKSLKNLVLQGCSRLENLPSSISSLNAIKYLSLSSCSDLKIVSSFPCNIERLDLTDCSSLESLPSSIGELKSLKYLVLQGCSRLENLPSSISSLNAIKDLSLSSCSGLKIVSSFPCNIEGLNLTDCWSLESLPSSIGELKSLKYLTLKGCSRLENLPSSISSLNAIKDLSLSSCSGLKIVSSFPCNIKRLDLTDCWSLESLSSSIGKLKSLKYLYLSGCLKLNSLPDEIGNLKDLFQLHAGDTGIREVPPSIVCLNNLCELDFERCKFQELPSSIENLSKLVTLNLNGCTRLESLPSSICKLKSLEYLFLFGCLKLNSLPDEIGNLEALMQLDVGDTGIREVPPSIVCLNNLYELDFEGCNVQEHVGLILGLISGLQCLKSLNLSNCGITELPSSLGQLTSLKRLRIGRNKFESIPASIINLSNLFYLDLCYCDVLKSLPELPSNIRLMHAHNCKSLELLSGLSSTDFNNWLLQEVNFINCLKLDQSAIEDMVKIILQSIRRHEYGSCHCIFVPGSSIPEWFTFRSKESSIELPPGCSNDDLVGFSLCVVISPRDDHNKSKELTLHYDAYCKPDGAQYEKWCGSLLYYSTLRLPPFIDSDHIVFGYMQLNSTSRSMIADFNSRVLYRFRILDEKCTRAECYQVKECGILLDPPLVGPPHAKRQKLA